MKFDNITNQIYIVAVNEAKLQCHEYVTPEHIIYAMLLFDAGKEMLESFGTNINQVETELKNFFDTNIYKIENCEPIESFGLINLFEFATSLAVHFNKNVISLNEIIVSIFNLEECFAAYILLRAGIRKDELINRFRSNKLQDNAVKLSDKNNITKKEYEYLKKYTVELTEKAYKNELDPLIGRNDILERTMQVLSRRFKNNPVHVGEAGVGKTAIVEGIAQKIASENVPDIIKNSKLYYLDMGNIIAGTKYRGDFEERLIKILDIILKEKNPIIYIDEIHTIVGAGAVSGNAMDATSILKPYLLKSNLKIIGSTTYSEYKKYFEKDHALVRRFQKIEVSEPSIDDCIQILNGIKQKYEQFHNVKYNDDAIIYACKLSDKYINDKHLPDKAIDIIDEAGAYVKLKYPDKLPYKIGKNEIEHIVSMSAKIPLEKISSDENKKLKNLDKNLKKEIFGQDEAIEIVVNAIKASRSGLNDSERPVANLLFVGPTGVGKTEIAKQLANNLGIALKRFDMSEYQEKHSVSRLIGAPPGYVGYEEGGLLTETINKTPYCVLLLDEIEKAHQDIFNVLLQIMDYGTLTDNIGKKSDFRNVIIIMTSNAGARNMNKHVIGFDDKIMNKEAIDNEVEKIFSPEFRNRLDSIVIFNDINEEMSILIAKKALNKLSERLKAKNIILKPSKNIYEYIAKKGLSKKYGAREINRIVENEIKKKLIDEVLFGTLSHGGTVYIDYKDEKVNIKTKKSTLKP